jgi:gliding motility-associated-like protein
MNLGSAEYIMYVEDSRGCTDTSTFFLDQPDSLYIDDITFFHVSCHGLDDGYIQNVIAIGGTPYTGIAPGSAPPTVVPYLYSVNGGQYYSNMGYFNSYGPGTYTVQILDSNNCAAQDIIIIEEPIALDVTITTSNFNGYEVQCNGGDNGTANISINGGNGPYIKTVLDVLADTIYSGLSTIIDNTLAPHSIGGPIFGGAGLYTFVITDNNGCRDSSVIIYQEPTPITHSVVIDHVTCTGWSNGSIIWNGSGGVGGAATYSYLWSTILDTNYSIDSLAAGNYSINVIDENNCPYDTTVVVNENNALSASVSNTQDPTCWDYCDGEIKVTPSGGFPTINSSGNPIYNYQWDDQLSQTTQTAIGLCVDNQTNTDDFECVITDALGCTITLSNITLNQPVKIVASIASISDYNTYNISCNGGDDGDITVSSSGGNSPTNMDYTWNTGQSGTSITDLLAGDYVVVAEDVLGCMDTLNITLNEPTAIEAMIDDIIDVDCYDLSTGEISVTVTGGTANIIDNYDYDWSPSNIGTASKIFVSPIGTGTLSGIPTGLYSVTVTDANGCDVESNSVYVKEPTNGLTILTDATDASCNIKGSATTYVSGGTAPYSYTWIPGGQTTKTASELNPNTAYTVTVLDANLCPITDATYINGYRNVFLPNNDNQIDETICLGTTVDILVEDQGYDYLWNTGQTTASITVTPEDFITIYTLSITDPACSTSYEVEAKFTVEYNPINPVATPNPLVLGDQVTIESSYAYSNYEWRWNWIDVVDVNSSTYPGYYQNTANGMSMTDYPESSTWYYVEVESSGCKGLDSVYVVVGPVPYDAISPNGDGMNDEWEILDISSYPTAEVKIFNRWGSLIFSSTGLKYNDNKWNGENGGKSLPVGTYYYTINLKDGSELQTGAVTIVR